MFRRLLAALVVLGIAASAEAAEFSLSRLDPFDVVHLKGPMISSDVETFERFTHGKQDVIVVLESAGGALLSGIKIGRIIRERGYATEVKPKTVCSSACAFAFLAGKTRHMYLSSRLGFHAVYIKNGNHPEITSSGNALVGGYLKELGLSDDAIMFATSAAPESMSWINEDIAGQLGLGIDFVDRDRHWRYADGYFFIGPNLNGETIQIKKDSDCQLMCEVAADCVAYSIHTNSRQCFLKRRIEKVVPNKFFSSARYRETPLPN